MHAPIRAGISARPIHIRAPGTALERVCEVVPHVASELPDAFVRGDIVNDDGGSPLRPDSPVRAGQVVWVFGGVPDEPAEPIVVPIVEENERWLAADKPHGMATMPRGSHVAQTLTVVLRRQFTNDELVAAHRLDAPTAGVVLVTKARQWRGTYQKLFEQRLVRKEYLAVANVDGMNPSVREEFARTTNAEVGETASTHRFSIRLEKPRGSLRTLIVPGEPNSITEIVCEHMGETLGAFRVRPLTGKTHQIRAVFAHLGMPLVGDDLYGGGNGGEGVRRRHYPLQLLAHSLEFLDPVTGDNVVLHTRRALALWELAHDSV